MGAYFGEYGGEVQRKFIGGGKERNHGDILTAEDVAGWPLSNRKSLQTIGKVKWFGPPSDAEEQVRQKNTPKAKKKTKSKPKAKTTRTRKKSTGGNK